MFGMKQLFQSMLGKEGESAGEETQEEGVSISMTQPVDLLGLLVCAQPSSLIQCPLLQTSDFSVQKHFFVLILYLYKKFCTFSLF